MRKRLMVYLFLILSGIAIAYLSLSKPSGLLSLEDVPGYVLRGYGKEKTRKIGADTKIMGRDLPIHVAAMEGQIEKLKQELINKENIEAPDSELRTPLYLAVKFQQLEAAKLLISSGANVNSQNLEMKAPPLFIAAQNNDIALIKLLIENRAATEQANDQGVTPLLQAAWQTWHKDTSGAEMLLTAGAKITAVDNAGFTAAHFAAAADHLKFLALLAQHKVDFNTKSIDGLTPLMNAVKQNREAAVKYLLTLGAKPDLISYRGETALTMAVQLGFWDVANALIAGGANTNRRNLSGSSPLYLAGLAGHRATVEALLKNGANPKEMFNGASIRYWLRQKGQSEIADLFEIYGGKFDDTTVIRQQSVARRDLKNFSGSYFVDRGNLISPQAQSKFSDMLNHLYNETGVDMRIALLRGESKGNLNQYASKMFTEIGIGKETQGRGFLFVYDLNSNQAKIEVGYGAEGFLPDVLVGYVLRENFLPLAKTGDLELALRLSQNIFSWRIREAILKDDFDPHAISLIASDSYLSGGAGALLKIDRKMKQESLNIIQSNLPTKTAKQFMTPENVYFAYLRWLVNPAATNDFGFLTDDSVQYVKNLAITKAYRDYIILMEFGKKYKILTKGDLAVQVFTDSPLPSPHFYRQENGSWRMDITGEVENAKSIVGGVYSWAMADKNSIYYKTFIDDLVNADNYLRFEVGDNRPMPVKAMGQL